MKREIQDYVSRECRKRINKHEARLRRKHEDRRRFERRTGVPGKKKTPRTADRWELDPHFNPYYVRPRAATIANAIARKIESGLYRPKPLLALNIPKGDGTEREVVIPTIPDAAVSSYLFYELQKRNEKRFSRFSFAFRFDQDAQDAIRHVKSCSRYRYVVKTDFARFFEYLHHNHVLRVLSERFGVVDEEALLLERFLRCQVARGVEDYRERRFFINTRGAPQGLSISLFLANVAGTHLDFELERLGVTFARYCDDLVILCESEEAMRKSERILRRHSEKCGAEINPKKHEVLEIADSSGSFCFLGHEISSRGVTLPPRVVTKMKNRLSKTICRHLLLYPRRGLFSDSRIGPDGIDWDMFTCIRALSRHLYGRLTEGEVDDLFGRESGRVRTAGSMLTFFSLVDDAGLFRRLDGWLLDVVRRAQKERARVLKTLRPNLNYRVYTKDELISGSWCDGKAKLPSFYLSWLSVRRRPGHVQYD